VSGSCPPGFEWDEQKNQSNISKHGIDFRDAVRVFDGPVFDRVDTSMVYSETRVNSLGVLDGQIVLNVTNTDRNGQTRLISARAATSRECELYREYLLELSQPEKPLGWADQVLEKGRRRMQERSRKPKKGHDIDDDFER
jgi:uncharacterized DUF497 family protein